MGSMEESEHHETALGVVNGDGAEQGIGYRAGRAKSVERQRIATSVRGAGHKSWKKYPGESWPWMKASSLRNYSGRFAFFSSVSASSSFLIAFRVRDRDGT